MDLVLYAIAFVMGGLVFRLLLYRKKHGEFEQQMMLLLVEGKRIVIAVDNDCQIYRMVDGRLKITKGIADFEENTDERISSIMDDFDTDQLDRDTKSDS